MCAHCRVWCEDDDPCLRCYRSVQTSAFRLVCACSVLAAGRAPECALRLSAVECTQLTGTRPRTKR
eukprot:2477864-Prymnesium_polylepis.2